MRLFLTLSLLLLALPALADLNGSEITSASGAVCTLNGSASLGATTASIACSSGTPLVGDVFYLGTSDLGAHRITALSGSGPWTATVSPQMGYWTDQVSPQAAFLSGEPLASGTALSMRLTLGVNAGACATASDKTTLAVGWITAHASDSRVKIARDQNLQTEWNAYDATPVTTHCVNVTHLVPSLSAYITAGQITASPYSTVGLYFLMAGSHRFSGCSGNACDSTALGPNFINGASGGGRFVQVVQPAADPGGSVDWDFYPYPVETPTFFQNNKNVIGLLWVLKGGPSGSTINQIYQTYMLAAKVDGVACTLGNPITCGSSGVTPMLVSQGQFSAGAGTGPETNKYVLYDAGKTQYYSYATQGFGYNSQKQIQLNLTTPAVGAHTVSFTLQQRDVFGTLLGSSKEFTYTFNVAAVPAQPSHAAQPASFPAVYNEALWDANEFWQSYTYCYSSTSGLVDHLYPLGNQYDSAYFSQYSRYWNYDPLRSNLGLSLVSAGAHSDWAALHAYTYGSIITPLTANAGGYAFVAINAVNNGSINTSGTSAASHPTWTQTIGAQVVDGSARWLNIGNYASWAECGELGGYTWRAWVNSSEGKYIQEPNNVAHIGLMADWKATGDVETHNALTTPNYTALGHLSNNSDNPQVKYLNSDFYTARIEFYSLDSFVASEMVGHAHQAQEDYLRDAVVGMLDQAAHCSSNTGWSVGACDKAFYGGLLMEAAIYDCEMKFSQGALCDGRIFDRVRAAADHYWSTAWNQSGYSCPTSGYSASSFCAFSYGGQADWPLTSANQNMQFVELNNLSCPAYAWIWSKLGDASFLPDGTTTYRAAGDACFGHAYDTPANYTNGGKEFNQNRAGWDYLCWRKGTCVKTATVGGTDYSYSPPPTFPEMITTVGATADANPPYHFWFGTVGPYPDTTPPAAPVTSTTATIWWNTYEDSTPNVCYSTVASMSGATCTSSGALHTQSSACGHAATTGTEMWNNCIVLSGLTPSTAYFYTVGGTDLASNIAKSSPGTGGAGPNSSFSFTPLNLDVLGVSIGTGVSLGSGVVVK